MPVWLRLFCIADSAFFGANGEELARCYESALVQARRRGRWR